jgi:hypothetical protein
MELTQDTAARKLDRKRLRPVLLSIPRYAREVSHVRTPSQLYQWFYYKLPYGSPLAEFPGAGESRADQRFATSRASIARANSV